MSPVNLGGYLVAFFAVAAYNARKLREMQRTKEAAAVAAAASAETEPLIKQQTAEKV